VRVERRKTRRLEKETVTQAVALASKWLRRPGNRDVKLIDGRRWAQQFPASSEHRFQSFNEWIASENDFQRVLRWDPAIDPSIDAYEDVTNGIQVKTSDSLTIIGYHGCSMSRYRKFLHQCRILRKNSSAPSDFSSEEGIYYSNSPIYAGIWAAFRASSFKSLGTPLERLQAVVVRSEIKLTKWAYVGKGVTESFISGNRNGSEMIEHGCDAVIGYFAGNHYLELAGDESSTRAQAARSSIVPSLVNPYDLMQLGVVGRDAEDSLNMISTHEVCAPSQHGIRLTERCRRT